MNPAYTENAEELCSLLVSEIAYDVLNTFQKDHTLCEADVEERHAIEKSLEKHLKLLPRYRRLLDKLFLATSYSAAKNIRNAACPRLQDTNPFSRLIYEKRRWPHWTVF